MHAMKQTMCCKDARKLALMITVITVMVAGSIALRSNSNHGRFKSFQNLVHLPTINKWLKSSDEMNPPILSFTCKNGAANYKTQLADTIVSYF